MHAGITGQEQVARKVCGMHIIIQGLSVTYILHTCNVTALARV